MEIENNSEVSTSQLEFIFPVYKNMLTQQPIERQRFWVQDLVDISRWDEEQKQQELERVQNNLFGENCVRIQDNENFDILFSFLNAQDSLNEDCKLFLIKQILNRQLKNLLNLI